MEACALGLELGGLIEHALPLLDSGPSTLGGIGYSKRTVLNLVNSGFGGAPSMRAPSGKFER